jgi:hypothetical protein
MLVTAGAAVTAVVRAAPFSNAASCPEPPALPSGFAGRIDNPYFPLAPGTIFVYRGRVDGKPARDVVSVTGRTKRIAGVETRVVRDRVFVRGELVEDTRDWFAQDEHGDVWYFGEDTRELEHGHVVSTEGSWEAGVDNARAGIFMPAKPAVGQVFKQEDARNVAEDCAKIVGLSASVRSPYVSSSRALKTKEFSLLERGVVDNKYYVRGIGLVREQTIRGGDDVLSLVAVRKP